MTAPLRFECPCGVSFGVPPLLAGQVGRCPVCARLLTAPGLPQPAPPPAERELPVEAAPFAMIRVDCPCGRRIPAPRARVRAGEARCPSCDRVLTA